MNVLIIEDRTADLERARRALVGERFRLHATRTLAGGLARLHAGEIDVVLLGLPVPSKAGLSALEHVLAACARLPVVILSSDTDESLARRALAMGAQDYLFRVQTDDDQLARALEFAVERWRAAESRREHQPVLSALLRNLPGMVYRCANDAEWTMEFVSEGCRSLTGYHPVDLLGSRTLSFAQMIHPEDREYVFQQVQRGLDEGRQFEMTYRIITADGQQKWVQEKGIGIHDASGAITALEGFISDITALKQAEQASHELEQRYRELFDNAGDAILVHDLNGSFLDANRVACERLGYSRDELLTMSAHDIDTPEFEPLITARTNEVQRCGHAVFETAYYRRDGSIVPVEISVRLIEYAGRQAILSTARDLSERQEHRRALEASERKFRSVIERCTDGIVLVDESGCVLEWNPGVAQIAGLDREDVVGRPLWDVQFQLLPERRKEQAAYHNLKNTLLNILQTGSTHSLGQITEVEIQRPDGEIRLVQEASFAIPTAQGCMVGTVLRDVTAHRQTERTLLQLAAIAESTTDAIMGSTLDGTVTSWNQGAEKLLGYRASEIKGHLMSLIVPAERQGEFDLLLESIGRGEVIQNLETVRQRKDGTRLEVSLSASPIRDAYGRIIGASVIARDITELKQTAAAERIQRTLAEALRDIILTLTSTLDIEVVMHRILENVDRVVPNDAANIMLVEGAAARVVAWRGYPDEFRDFFETARFSLEIENLRDMYLSGEPSYIPDTRAFSGWMVLPETEWVRSYVAVPIRAHGQVIGLLNLDSRTPNFFEQYHADRLQIFADQAAVAIENAQLYDEIRFYASELEQRVEQRTTELNRTKERVEAILNSSSDPIILAHTDGSIQQANPAFERVFGYQNDELFSMPLTRLFEPEAASSIRAALRAVMQPGQQPVRVEVTARRKHGEPLEVELGLSVIATGQETPKSVVCSVRDITARKRTEQALREALQREKELSDLKVRFVTMTSHEFRTPLATIQAAADSLRSYRRRMDDAKIDQRLNKIEAQVRHMALLLDDVLTVGRGQAGQLEFVPAPVNLDEFCREVIGEFAALPDLAQRLVYTCLNDRPDCVQVCVDKKLIRQVITNLLSNALKYSPPDSVVQVELACDEDAVLRVRDEGIGIPDEDQKRLFEAFHRAANVGNIPGSGLGLAIAHQAVDLHGGTMTFESRVGDGTTFIVTLPGPERDCNQDD